MPLGTRSPDIFDRCFLAGRGSGLAVKSGAEYFRGTWSTTDPATWLARRSQFMNPTSKEVHH